MSCCFTHSIFQYTSTDLLLIPDFRSLGNCNCSGASVLKEAVPRHLKSYCIISLCTNSRVCILNTLFVGFEDLTYSTVYHNWKKKKSDRIIIFIPICWTGIYLLHICSSFFVTLVSLLYPHITAEIVHIFRFSLCAWVLHGAKHFTVWSVFLV